MNDQKAQMRYEGQKLVQICIEDRFTHSQVALICKGPSSVILSNHPAVGTRSA